MQERTTPHKAPWKRWPVAALFGGAVVLAISMTAMGADVPTRAAVIAVFCLTLWLTGWTPVWIPTLVLWGATPMLLAFSDARFQPLKVLQWSADPVLALFLAGFSLAAAARRCGVDEQIAARAIAHAGTSSKRLLITAAFCTALLAMWMSNVAAAALMLNAFRPIWEREPQDSPLRRALLLSIALAADVAGIATPIGTGANGIAIAAVAPTLPVGFLRWMTFGVPLALLLVAATVGLVLIRLKPSPLQKPLPAPDAMRPALHEGAPYRRLGAIFCITILLWLTEPLTGIPAWMVALGSVGALLMFRVLGWRDIAKLDWSTLLLVAGGIGLGALLERSGIIHQFAAGLPIESVPETIRLLGLCLVAALLAALMSNTGTAALLIPIAATVDPAPSTAIIVAIATSLGMPFVISTPPNAMAVACGLRANDLLVPGIILMLGGCVLIALTGPWVIQLMCAP
ncbi:MAG: SLC13 family permease [Verrucomicrobiota bacterium]